MLYKLLTLMDRSIFEMEVISLTDLGLVGKKIQDLGLPVEALGLRRGVPDPLIMLHLSRLIRQRSPNLIQTWMYHADLLGGLAAKSASNIPVIWNIRHSNLDFCSNKFRTIMTAKICAWLSHKLPLRIICCSEASKKAHAIIGYSKNKMIVIPNGFDISIFKPNPDARLFVRQYLDIPKETFLIGLVGRFDPQKDHHNFVQAAARLHSLRPDIHFLLCGNGITWKNSALVGWIETAGIRDCFHLLGERADIPNLTAALDIASLSSCGEGFPNVIGEAMACGVPCVVTDVGDSAVIVGNAGKVVSPKDPQALAAAWNDLINMEPKYRRQMGLASRRRIEEHYSLPAIVAQYVNVYKGVVAHV